VIQGDRKNFQSGSERGTPEYIENIIKKARDALPKGKRNYLTTAEFAKLIGFESTRPSRLTEVLKSGVDYSKNISEAIKKFADPILSPFKFGRGQYFFKPVKGEALEIIKAAVAGEGPEKQTVPNVKIFTEGKGKTLLNNSLKNNKLPSFKSIQNIKKLTPSRIVTALTWVVEASKNRIAGLDFIPIDKKKGNKIFRLMMDESAGNIYNQYATQVYKNALKSISKQLRQPQNTFGNLKERIRTWAKKKGFPIYSTKNPVGFNVDEILGVKVSSRFKLGPYSVFSRLVDGYLNQRPLARFQGYMAKEIEKLKLAIKKHGANSKQAKKIVENFTKQKTYVNLRDDLDARGAKNIKLPELTLKSPDKIFGSLRLEELEDAGLDFKKFYNKNKFGFSNLEGATTQKELLEKIKKGEIKTKGPMVSSFAGSINLNFLPTEVTATLAKAGGAFSKLLKGAGFASVPLDAITLSEQASKGLTGFDLANTTALRVAEQTLNAPREIASIFGKEDLYEPFTFGSEYSKKVESSIPMDVRKENLRKLKFDQAMPIVDDMEIAPSKKELEERYKSFKPEIDTSNLEPEKITETREPDSDLLAGLLEESGSPYLQFLQGGGQLTPEEFNQLQSIPQSERPLTGELDLPEMDQTMMAAQGGRVGFQDGSPDPFVDQAIAALDNPNVANQFLKDNQPSVGEMILGKEGDRSLMQSFNTQFLDPRSYPYYAQKTLRGAANIPELAVRFPLAAAYIFGKASLATSTADLSKFSKEDLNTAMEILEPKFTNLALEGKLGDVLGLSPEAIQAAEEKRTGPQKTTGDLLQFTGEAVGPATPLFLFKIFPKLSKQIKDLVGTATAADKVNKEIENKMATQGVDQTRRDLLIATGVGGAVGLLKMLGLDNLFKAAPKAVAKQAPEIITSGGTPKYFFDFVDLIKKKGKDISDEAATVERQRVYDYKDYTLYENLDTNTIRITKDTEGASSYYIGDGEYDTVTGIIRKEEITYTPKETIINDKGKPVEVKDTYDEGTVRPDYDGKEGDYEAGLDSIDEILDLLSKDGKTYSEEELLKMGIDPKLTNVPTGAGTIPKDMIGEVNPFKPKVKKAGGGIMKMAGDESGPPPKSGPTPHGLPYVAKNVRPIKERK
jgi:hypothetical protein